VGTGGRGFWQEIGETKEEKHQRKKTRAMCRGQKKRLQGNLKGLKRAISSRGKDGNLDRNTGCMSKREGGKVEEPGTLVTGVKPGRK